MDKKPKLTVSDAAIRALIHAGKPLHVSELVKGMTAIGWISNSPTAEHVVYSTLRSHIQRHEGAAGIWLTNGRIFGLPDQGVEAYVAPEKKSSTPIKKMRLDLDVFKTCGSCQSIHYSGPGEVTLYSGMCNKWELTNRAGVLSAADATGCEHWTQRPLSVINKDGENARNMRVLVGAVNQSMKHRTRKDKD